MLDHQDHNICFEAWPLKSKPKALYVCSQCSWDKNENQIQEMLINHGGQPVILRAYG
jgi:hypothetical protein